MAIENNKENNTITVQTPWGYSPRNQVTQVNRTPTIYDQNLIQGLSTYVQKNTRIFDLSYYPKLMMHIQEDKKLIGILRPKTLMQITQRKIPLKDT